MLQMGRFNTLKIVRQVSFGLYLDGDRFGDILLPRRDMPADNDCRIGTMLSVFIYLDSEDRPIATTRQPAIQVDEFASLKIIERTPVGLFLDWGLPKDLLLPHSEVRGHPEPGDHRLVHAYLDERTHRITATMRLNRHLDLVPPRYDKGQPVELLITGPTDLGFNAIVDNTHTGLLHHSEVHQPLRTGMRIQGYIRRVRDDGRIDLGLNPPREQIADALGEQIMARLESGGGTLAISDRSSPELIKQTFGVSKATFKKTIGGLYKRQLILIHPDRIELRR
ncbi:S1 RNA-binding domain-containing protein [Kushneria phosphatilytica]|uniref:GntR family transcriptional regulator n=1 Tax=Kushneria phosphatilytica TaxID=657387 RepID=A0A1S1NS37_9GAMM|nr:S1-like domain-containing RNA-binding protein [Kushneria phosphatilytica]OHV07708.1 GntR family transcriptional regulator [Kushneria phosphatilytica]QEL10205.1 GntR family transcriptional regulator [Kushneria phosphatilytica]